MKESQEVKAGAKTSKLKGTGIFNSMDNSIDFKTPIANV